MNKTTSKLDLHLDTQARNHRFKHYNIDEVLVPSEHVRSLHNGFHKQRETILADRNLTDEGKANAIAKARATTHAAISEFHDERMKNIAADRLEQRAALLSDNTVPNPKHVELMASQMMKLGPRDIAAFYDKANENERRTMEAASAFVGRVMTMENNGRQWKPLLDPEMVNEAIMARAAVTNPTAAQKLRELDEIRAMQVTITNVALSEI